MTIIFCMALASLALWCLGKVLENYGYKSMFCHMLSVLVGMALAGMLIATPFCRYDVRSKIHAMRQLETVLHESREFDPLERVAIQNRVAAYNVWLAKAKYSRTTAWKLWYPSDVDTADYINQKKN